MEDYRASGRRDATGHAVPLVGRRDELEAIERAFRRVIAGEAPVLLLEGRLGSARAACWPKLWTVRTTGDCAFCPGSRTS
jgi:hypothetical protein